MSPAVLTSPEAGIAAGLPWLAALEGLDVGAAVFAAVPGEAAPPHAATPRMTAIAAAARKSRLGVGRRVGPLVLVTGPDGVEAR
jgi:hypothetical protein